FCHVTLPLLKPVLAVVILAVGAFAGGSVTGLLANASASPTPLPSDAATLAPVGSTTPAPKSTSDIVTYSPPPPATPTPPPDPGLWRYEGVVVDEQGKPIEGVCVAVGPQGCLPSSIRTDKRGVWFIDFPQAPVDYDLHFSKKGYTQYDVRITPTSPWTLNVVLKG
ncbi:MAG: carboxypeptidase-like regulatory domain-containing protein, partial [Chloroflexota bacterium]